MAAAGFWIAIARAPAQGQETPAEPPPPFNDAALYSMTMASGTSVNPESSGMPMLMRRAGSWNLMFMGQSFVMDTQQSGPRGGDKLYSLSAFMISAEHRLGRGSVTLETMLSLEPATVTGERYPLLFQTGETAYGKPLSDGQHPHDFLMGLGAEYARPLSENTMLQLYYAPVGDPALGPVAFPTGPRRPSCRRRRLATTGRIRRTWPTTWRRWR